VHPCKEIKLKFDLQRMVERTAKKICAGTPRITRGMGTNITLEPGERAEFLCAVDHSCMVSSIKWFHATPDNLTITLIKTAASPGDPHVHLIPSVLPSHSGTYSCVAENVLGQVFKASNSCNPQITQVKNVLRQVTTHQSDDDGKI
jgi:hypothetical protein